MRVSGRPHQSHDRYDEQEGKKGKQDVDLSRERLDSSFDSGVTCVELDGGRFVVEFLG